MERTGYAGEFHKLELEGDYSRATGLGVQGGRIVYNRRRIFACLGAPLAQKTWKSVNFTTEFTWKNVKMWYFFIGKV